MTNPQFQAKVVADSINPAGVRLTTLQLLYPRFIHAELMTHRMFSRGASSSRAIPVAKMIDQVRNDPAMPIHWGANIPGMQANEELPEGLKGEAMRAWLRAARQVADIAEEMAQYKLHKQVANRILEPFQLMSVIVTATEWDNFFLLRDHPMAQPEIQLLAKVMKAAMHESKPAARGVVTLRDWTAPDRMQERFWHLPYISDEERGLYRMDVLLKLSTARCARVSYKNHDGTEPNVNKDIDLHDQLVASEPKHASPTEHQALALSHHSQFFKNFRGWVQYRQVLGA